MSTKRMSSTNTDTLSNTTIFAIPSMRGYTKSSKGEKINYYAQPWERGADINGEVDRGKEYAGLEGIGTSQDDSSYYVKLKKFKQKILKFLDELNE